MEQLEIVTHINDGVQSPQQPLHITVPQAKDKFDPRGLRKHTNDVLLFSQVPNDNELAENFQDFMAMLPWHRVDYVRVQLVKSCIGGVANWRFQ